MRQLDARQMAEQHAVAVQRALGRPGGAGRVDHHRRIVRPGCDRREGRGSPRDRLGETACAVVRSVGREHEAKLGKVFADLGDLRRALGVGHHRLGAGILQPVGQSIDAEQHRERQRDGAELVDGDVGDDDFRHLRQENRDAVAARDAVGRERVGKPVRALLEPAVADLTLDGDQETWVLGLLQG